MIGPTRRAFLQRLATGSYALLPLYHDRTMASVHYIGKADCIEVFEQNGGYRRKIQRVTSAHPKCMVLNHAATHLFVANDIAEYQGLPTGTVESYKVAPSNGLLQLVSRRPLALSATKPKHLAISPDDAYLAVAVYGGGAYNVLPISRDGEIGSVIQALKEIGRGLHPVEQATAHPHSVAFHPSGKFVIATDFGCDRINVFAFQSGRLSRVQQIIARPGSGPAKLRLESDGRLLFVEYSLRASRSCYRFDQQTGRLSRLIRDTF